MMTDNILAMTVFAVTLTMTPGPNTLMLAASGANFGLVRTLPHMLGVMVGCTGIMIAASAGVAALVVEIKPLYYGLQLLGAAYLLYLAWRIAFSRTLSDRDSVRPLSVKEAALFQFLNPKAVTGLLSAAAVFLDPRHGDPWLGALAFILVVNLVGLVGMPIWIVTGQAIRTVLNTPRRLKLFNAAMGALLALSVLWLIDFEAAAELWRAPS